MFKIWFFNIIFIITVLITRINSSIDEIECSGDFNDDLIITDIKKFPSSFDTPTYTTNYNNEHFDVNNNNNNNNNNKNITEIIDEFLELIPAREIKEKILDYYRNDKYIQQIYEYLYSKEFKNLRKDTFELREVKELINHLAVIGLNVKEIGYKIDNLLELSKIKPTLNHKIKSTTTIGGLYGLLDDIFSILPQYDIFVLYSDKMDNSKEFARLMHNLERAELMMKLDTIYRSADFQIILTTLRKHRFEVNKLRDIIKQYFGFF